MDNEAEIREILAIMNGRLDKIEQNVGGLGTSVNSVVDTVNGFMENVKAFMESGALGKVTAMLGMRNDG